MQTIDEASEHCRFVGKGIEQATCAFVKRLIARVQEGAAPLKQ